MLELLTSDGEVKIVKDQNTQSLCTKVCKSIISPFNRHRQIMIGLVYCHDREIKVFQVKTINIVDYLELDIFALICHNKAIMMRYYWGLNLESAY